MANPLTCPPGVPWTQWAIVIILCIATGMLITALVVTWRTLCEYRPPSEWD